MGLKSRFLEIRCERCLGRGCDWLERWLLVSGIFSARDMTAAI
jgi:hypothetical protein